MYSIRCDVAINDVANKINVVYNTLVALLWTNQYSQLAKKIFIHKTILMYYKSHLQKCHKIVTLCQLCKYHFPKLVNFQTF